MHHLWFRGYRGPVGGGEVGLVEIVGVGPFQNLPGTVVDEVRDVIEVFGGEPSKVGAFREVLAEERLEWSPEVGHLI